MHSDSWTSEVSVKGHNEAQDYNAPFIPASLSLEWNIFPQVAIFLGGHYRYLISKQEVTPKNQVAASLGLRIRFN